MDQVSKFSFKTKQNNIKYWKSRGILPVWKSGNHVIAWVVKEEWLQRVIKVSLNVHQLYIV